MLIGAWPSDLPLPFFGGYAPSIPSASGGQAEDGTEQVQPQLHDRWTAQFSFHLGTDARILAARSLLTRLRGRANSVLVPAFDRRRAPVVVTPGSSSGLEVGDVITAPPFWRRWLNLAGTGYEFSALGGVTGNITLLADDRASLNDTGDSPVVGNYVTLASVRREIVAIEDDTGPIVFRFRPALTMAGPASPDVSGTVVTAVLNADADLNAITADLLFSVGGPPLPGHLFSLGNRLHAIDSVTVLGANLYQVEIWPWLRADVASGTVADFVTPKCEMRLASDQEGAEALRSLSLGLYGDITLRFDEVS